MKTLYLHCGYHKTGSSFLQTMFARHRDLLHKQSIHYPFSPGEYEMLQGILSPGNGKELSDALLTSDTQNTAKVLEKGKKEAAEAGCNSLLYSAEGLFHLFPKERVLERLCNAAEIVNIDQVCALIYFRDPIPHALSTYKHRAKNGKHHDFTHWLENSYETMGLLDDFCRYRSKFNIKWSCRKYVSDSHFMVKSTFHDWLEAGTPPIPEDDRVNSSLTLSEIRILQAAKKRYETAIPFLYNEFISLNRQEKSRDTDMNNFFESETARVLANYRELIEEINGFLPEDENLNIDLPNENEPDFKTEPDISLSFKQAEAYAVAAKKSAKSEKLTMKAMDIWKRGTRKIVRKLKAAGY